ncbi:OprD family outer membrane porin [Sulfuricurvum sp.]|uniref:OprD family outer membrane porin n=1 Tax=Sulfuricurvum sp. TaxID=2025608 RepID=UPI003BB1C052
MKSIKVTLHTLLILTSHVHAEVSWGTLHGQIRSYTMVEDNQDPLRDYEATAIGGKLLYQTPQWRNLQGTIALYTTHFINDNVSTQSIEPLASNKNSRYVVGLVDSTDYDASSVTKIGEAYLRYLYDKSSITLGRMKLDTPFVNPQDGRMLPTLEQGIWATSVFMSGWSAQAGYINAFWNRNTPEWKSVEDSLGYGYEMGMSALDTTVAGNYYNNTSSDGLFIGNLRYETKSGFRLDMWDYYLENIFNLGYAEANYSHSMNGVDLSYGLQYIDERQSGDGGNGEDNLNPTNALRAKSYMQEGEKSKTYGVKTALKYENSKLTFAYNRTTDEGRFLFPREWGKEPLFTFQKRERSDGSGNCHAWLSTLEHNFAGQGLNGLDIILGYGEYTKTDPKQWKYNKYGTPSYAQWDIDIFYRFGGMLQGLKAEYLLVRKVARGETYQLAGASEYNFIFRKNGMTLHNFVLNYDF